MIVDRAGTKSNEFGVVHNGISPAGLVSSPAITLDRTTAVGAKDDSFLCLRYLSMNHASAKDSATVLANIADLLPDLEAL
jgi:hypothetical protein